MTFQNSATLRLQSRPTSRFGLQSADPCEIRNPKSAFLILPAFTLVELLVVIAIISLLLSILLPALSGARKAGRAALCMTHLRALGQAMELYANDFDGAVVRSEDQWNDVLNGQPYGSPGLHFTCTLLPGLGYQKVNVIGELYRQANEPNYMKQLADIPEFQCPDFPDTRQPLDFVVNGFRTPYPDTADGGQAGGGPRNENVQSSIDNIVYDRLNRMRASTSRIIYLTEGNKDLPVDTLSLSDCFLATQLPLGAYPRMASDQRHPGGLNALFFDTHVERMALKEMDAGWPNPLWIRLRYFANVP